MKRREFITNLLLFAVTPKFRRNGLRGSTGNAVLGIT
jgi:hypothetical protein